MASLKYRHEWKHEISYADSLTLRQRLSSVAARDSHARDGTYKIRSLYFDDISDRMLREKIDGVNIREKFRIRYYDEDTTFIRLEKKSKINCLCTKTSARLTKKQAQAILDGHFGWMIQSGLPLIEEFYTKIISRGLRPKTIVDYIREPFIFSPGNVRVTLDSDIRIGVQCADFFNPSGVTIPAGDAPIILEVKWDEFLPDIIRDAVQLNGCRAEAFSKYAACRIYG